MKRIYLGPWEKRNGKIYCYDYIRPTLGKRHIGISPDRFEFQGWIIYWYEKQGVYSDGRLDVSALSRYYSPFVKDVMNYIDESIIRMPERSILGELVRFELLSEDRYNKLKLLE